MFVLQADSVMAAAAICQMKGNNIAIIDVIDSIRISDINQVQQCINYAQPQAVLLCVCATQTTRTKT